MNYGFVSVHVEGEFRTRQVSKIELTNFFKCMIVFTKTILNVQRTSESAL